MYHSLYGRLLGHDGSQLLYNQRPLSFSAKGPRGKVVFVDSNVAASDGFSPDTALATLDAAFDKVTANQGDVIYVMPKHAETLSGANGVLQDIAGVSVIGLGEGNQRPTFTYSTSAAATYGITAADSVVENLLFIGNVSNVVAGITTTKSGTKLRKLEFRNAGTNKDFLTPIKAHLDRRQRRRRAARCERLFAGTATTATIWNSSRSTPRSTASRPTTTTCSTSAPRRRSFWWRPASC
jgi:hypothetical protein